MLAPWLVVNVELNGIEVRLRAKNQLTLPEAIVAALGARPGDRLRMTATSFGIVTLRLLRRSYAGALGRVVGRHGR